MKLTTLKLIAALTVALTLGRVVAEPMPAGPTAATPSSADRAPSPAKTQDIDLVICLDTSGSMSNLIDSAKQRLWSIVNELAAAEPKPNLRVALYHYGNTGLDKETGWVKQLCPLTDDLDTVYSKLFALRTNGGDEYVARVVRASLLELKWSDKPNALRTVFVAGNEAATQDPQYKLQDICKQAAGKGVIVNTIFCGDDQTGRQSGWADAAKWADGQYASISAREGTIAINTPHDKKLAELSRELNTTYLGYGQAGKEKAELQSDMDAAAEAVNAPAAAQRAAAKSSGLYVNNAWDLVDAVNNGKVDLAKVEKKDLPEKMQSMTPEQRKQHIAELTAKRKEIQQQIQQLSKQRDAYVREELQKRQAAGAGTSLDAALTETVRKQATAKGFTFSK